MRKVRFSSISYNGANFSGTIFAELQPPASKETSPGEAYPAEVTFYEEGEFTPERVRLALQCAFLTLEAMEERGVRTVREL